MKKALLFCLLVTFSLTDIYAQKEYYNWYFGCETGMTFNPDGSKPVSLADSKMCTLEGCSSISDSQGNLLFYTNGVSVWNKEHKMMLNGDSLMGNESSVQSALIVPKPNDLNYYYIFTVDFENSSSGLLCYSIVDMSLDNGNGGILSKNVHLYTPACEQLAGVNNYDGSGYWILVHKHKTDEFLAFSVTEIGVNDTPVISRIGILILQG